MKKYIGLSIVALSMGLASCNDYLDKLPDNRMEPTTPSDFRDLLVSAYPDKHPAYLLEMYSDNADDCDNTGWTEADRFQRQAFHWDDITEIGEDESPQELWNSHYTAIAAANAVIQYVDALPVSEQAEYSARLGEALLCRAYAMFQLSTVFCNAYDPSTASSEMGLPYPEETQTTVGQTMERLSLQGVYEKIDADIQRGLPLVTNVYDKPKFHFTQNAANAFAARFYLNYQKYGKTIEHANKVLGSDPSAVLRDWEAYDALDSNGQVQPEYFIQAGHTANLLLQVVYSSWGAIGGNYRTGNKYAHGNVISRYETMQSQGPWGSSANFRYTVWYNRSLSKYIFRKVPYEFEYTDVQAGIGFSHSEYAVFTTDLLLLERAEAYALLGDSVAAVKDINTELAAFYGNRVTLTPASIRQFYNSINYYEPLNPTPKKHLNPKFSIGEEGGTQESILQCILHLRRILGLHEGLRMQDVKRYGIVIYRRVMNANYEITQVTDSLTVGDPRRAIQIPQDVISASMPGNPRETVSQGGNEVAMETGKATLNE